MRTRTFLPRPEYPRPDRQRSFIHGVDWINLNGAWEFRFDGDDRGRNEGWHLADEPRWSEQIIVPFCWESLAAWGEADAAGNDNFYSTRAYRDPLQVTTSNYRSAARYEIGWYRRTVRIPDNNSWKNRRVILTIGAADFFTEAWCNGRALGRHEGGYTPFEFDITNALLRDEAGQLIATIVLRVEDPINNREQPVGKQWGWYSSASGIWQTVFLEPRSETFIKKFEITTDIERGEARFLVSVSGGEFLEIEVTSPSGERFVDKASIIDGLVELTFSLGNVVLWDPNSPQLYRARLVLYSSGNPDVVHTYFGMRSLAAVAVPEASSPSALALNGAPIYLRGALYQSYFPDGIYTAGDSQVLENDILTAKRAGFDLLRVHIKVDDPMLLHYADTLGILLMCDFPNFGEGGDTSVGRARFEQTMRGAIERDFNHPSIVAWCLFNETWGFGGQSEFVKLINPHPPESGSSQLIESAGKKLSNQSAYLWVQSIYRLAKSLDPTRLIEDMSVVAWEHLEYYGHGETDVNSWHFYTDNYAKARSWIEEIVEKTFAGSTYNYVPGFKQGNQPLINSEYGGVGALDGDVDTSWSFKFLTNELRRHGRLSAYIYTELHDVEWERNGFLNYDRTPKDFGYDPTIVNQGDVLPIDAPPIQSCRAGATVTVPVFSSHFSRQKRQHVSLHWRLSGVDSLGWIHSEMASGSDRIAFPHLQVELAKALTVQLPMQTMLCTLWVYGFVVDGTPVARNFVQFYVDGGAPAREVIGRQTILRLQPHQWHSAEWNRSAKTREEAEKCGACAGGTRGFFEWHFPVSSPELNGASRIRLLLEASSLRDGAPQTDSFVSPSALRISLNGIPVYHTILPNHPHDARGALSYLLGGRGAYGYLCHAVVEGSLLGQVKAGMKGKRVRLRCSVPRDEQPQAGLTIYGPACGRYPIGPTLIIE
jgi:Glycosyl hydrolases family 2, sugar binding domain/Glycosyl hydrolases family 2, TIM barrel domain/Glycosyl hydrolases family 2